MGNVLRSGCFDQNRSGLAATLIELWTRHRSKTAKTLRQMELLETLSMGGKRQLMLVRCAGKQFLVGGGPDSIDCIVPVGSEQDQLCG